MKILFVSSGSRYKTVNPIVDAQARSLQKEGCHVSHFTIVRGGLSGYISGLRRLFLHIRSEKYDIVHAHYGLSGITAALAGSSPLVVSLMGSDLYSGIVTQYMARIFARLVWTVTIVKSNRMKLLLGNNNAYIIPNGVDTSLFRPLDKGISMRKSGFNQVFRHILFFGNPGREEKNYPLALKAVQNTGYNNIQMHIVRDVPHEEIPLLMSAADLLLVTSSWEGSPNVVKEAMACNLPVVATDVGDIGQLIAGSRNCFTCSDDPIVIGNCIKEILDAGTRSDGRQNIMHLDSALIARRLIEIYKSIAQSEGN